MPGNIIDLTALNTGVADVTTATPTAGAVIGRLGDIGGWGRMFFEPVPNRDPVPPERWDDFRLGDLVKTVGSVNRNKGRIGRIVYIIWRKDLPKVGTRDNMHTHREFIVEWLPDDKTETHASASIFQTHSGLALAHYDEYNL